jgi:tripartite-type tricarboxylate transporter receptor subunit TctC
MFGCSTESRNASSAARTDFYAGETLEVIVPFGPGGGSDTWTRMIVPFLQQHLGEGARVQVVNIPGASSVAGTNDFALRRRPDGLTALVSAGTTYLVYLMGEPMVRYDFGDFSPILASAVGGVVFVSPDLGIASASQLRDSPEPLVYGGISATGNDILPLLSFELLRLDVKAILGYASKGASRVAFEQGETNIEYQTMPAYLSNVTPLVADGSAVPLFSFGVLSETGEVVRDPAVPDLPTVREVYQDLFAREPSGVEWEGYKVVLAAGVAMAKVLWLHDEAPEEAIQALRNAARQVVADPEFQEVARREVGGYPFHVGEEAGRAASTAARIAPTTLNWLKALLRDKYDIDRLR